MTTYKLNYECNRSYGPASGYILYTAESPADAVAAALRWIHSRESLPDLFGKFLYFEISPYSIGPISQAGDLETRNGFRLMEWSRDRAGVDKETYCEWKIAEFTRSK